MFYCVFYFTCDRSFTDIFAIKSRRCRNVDVSRDCQFFCGRALKFPIEFYKLRSPLNIVAMFGDDRSS